MRSVSRTMTGLLLGTALLIPSIASAQDRSFNWQRGGQDRSGGAMVNGDNRREAVQAAREARRNSEQARPTPAPVANPGLSHGPDGARAGVADRNQRWSTERGAWNRGGQPNTNIAGGNPAPADRGRWDGQRGDNGRVDNDRRPDPARQADRNDRRDRNDRNWNGRPDDNRRDLADRRDNDRRDWNNRRDNDRRNWDNRSWGRRDNDRWDRSWRNDRRYSWQDYRSRNRTIYRLPRYQAPRWGYSYQRWNTGHRFDPWFYSSSYWIDDPFSYRLPPAYGDYRWVRYYDDAALVDIRSGEIVDIIYSFFF